MVAQTRKIKADCGVEPGGFKPASGNCAGGALPGDAHAGLAAVPSISSPKVTSTLVNTDVLAEGLKKFTPVETSPHTSCRSSLRVKFVPVETSVVCCRRRDCPTGCRSRTAPWWCRSRPARWSRPIRPNLPLASRSSPNETSLPPRVKPSISAQLTAMMASGSIKAPPWNEPKR